MAKETKLFRLEAHLHDEKEFPNMSGYRIFIGYKAIKHVHLFNCARLEHYRVDPSIIDKIAKKGLEPLDINKAKTYLAAIETNRSRNRTLKLWDGGRWCDVFTEMLKGASPPEKEPADEKAPEPVTDYVAPQGEAAKAQEEGARADLVKASKEAKAKRADKQAEKVLQQTERAKGKGAKKGPAPSPKPEPEPTPSPTAKAKKKAKSEPAAAKGKPKAAPSPKPEPEPTPSPTAKAKAKGKAEPAAAKGKAEPAAAKKHRSSGIPEGSIRFLVKGNPRSEGTKANARYAAMVNYVAKHPKAKAQEVIANTIYRGDDLRYDIEHEFIEVK